jgi:hypothetical protein
VTIGSDNIFPSVKLVETASGSLGTVGASNQRLAIDPTSHLLYWKDNSGTVRTALANPMTTSQDVIVGGASGAPGRLAAGAAGGVLAMGNSAVIWNAGTSFPGSKATGDRYWRTDLNDEYVWDGTRWLGRLREVSFSSPTALMPTATSGSLLLLPISGIADYWVERFVVTTQTAAPNDSSHYWTVNVTRYPSATIIGGNALTNGDTVDVPTRHIITVGALTGTSDTMLLLAMVKNSTPGPLYCLATMQYRPVGT